MKLIFKKVLVLLVLGTLSSTLFAAQDYNSSRSNRGSKAEDVEAVVSRLTTQTQREVMTQIKQASKTSKGKDADAYKDVSITLKVKITPSTKTRAQDYNSSRSNSLKGPIDKLDGQLRKQLLQMQNAILKDFRKKHPKKGASSRTMPDSFFDIWVEVSATERKTRLKAKHKK